MQANQRETYAMLMCQLSGKPETIHVVTVLLIMHAGSKIFVQLSC